MKAEITELLGFRRYNFQVIDSTNLQAKKYIDENINPEFLVTADTQSYGKGRTGRQWYSEDGNLFVTIVLDSKPIKMPELFTYYIALAVSGFLDENGLKSSIKWPNDVLVNGKKICGILLEGYKERLIIGVGFNVISSPEYVEDARLNPTDLKKNKIDMDREEVLTGILSQFNKMRGKEFSSIKESVEEKLHNKGKEVIIDAGKRQKGSIQGISDRGLLILKTDEGISEIGYGEIFSI